MVWRHGKNTQFRVLRQGAKWTKWRWSVIFCCFLTLSICFFSKRSAKQFRQIGQNCKGKHRERSRNVSFTLFFFPSVSFSDTVLFSKSLTWIFCDGNSETKRLRQGYQGQGCVMVFDCTTIHQANSNYTPLPSKTLTQLLWLHCSSVRHVSS